MITLVSCDFPDHANGSVFWAEHSSRWSSSDFTAGFQPRVARAALSAEFSELLVEHSTPDWNGYRADPISPEAASAACQLMAHLPGDIPSPSLGAVPEGLVTFEWYRGPKHIVSVIANTNYTVDYAIRRGDEILHGSSPSFGTLPDTVLNHIRRQIR